MKIQLSQVSNINVLTVSDGVDLHSFNVLKAGVTKLFQDGKNKIIIHLQGIAHMPPEVMREIALLDLTAKELSGRIAASGVGEELKKEFMAFSKPPAIPFFATLEGAIEFFQRTDSVQSGDDFNVLKEENAKLQKEIEALKAKIASVPEGLVESLQFKNKELQSQNDKLQNELALLYQERRRFASPAALQEQIQILEETIRS
jgi:anti-anti-sigma regulatory factor/regulator of replication initiation timing